ncbi:CoB--CoM heterodisulfide reductase iron-sulfur subunit B family protein [Calderihabitans maritimus]|uniref:Heterodisulfide reductase, subunit B n=1 Tax=Calderihabitans maritimus TaxID=1246530 RepID=A0A1Z5HQN0_9FIRM|nr:CoB--CoM heterodisulfide reductase iron-sulfur subunit B family protein [Calderihabitans maritimus]GAW91842.1 heterodisulfide reductase, subunit B [Calderihabitans maritimus]
MKFTYYPGCSLHSTAEEYNLSNQAVFRALDIELEELNDWNCCGATSAHSTNEFLSHALPLRNLVLAERQGNDVVVPCAACYNLLRNADHHVRFGGEKGESLNAEIEAVMGSRYRGEIAVRHIVDVLTEPEVLKKLESKIKKPLEGLKLAAYYGCLLTRPPKVVSFEENPEQPCKLDLLIEKVGADSVRWSYKTDCCGGSLSISQPELVIKLTQTIVEAARYAGAEAIVCACPLCQANLDTRQHEAGGGPGGSTLPVLYITEVLGLALGLPGSEQWFRKHLIDPAPLLKSLDLLPAS